MRIPSNVKFLNEILLDDGSYLSWFYPSGKLRKKGFKPIQVRVIEYTIENYDRPEAQIRYRLITSLLDAENFPAPSLAGEYHQRWEVENTIDEIKVHLWGRKTHIRSQRPKEVVQKIYGLLLGPKSCTIINFSLQQAVQVFHHCVFLLLKHYELFVVFCAKIPAITTTGTSIFLNWLTLEILDQLLPERVHRNNPRVVKKPVSKFRSKQVKHRGTGIIMNPPVFIVLSTA